MSTEPSPGDQPAPQPQDEPHPQPGPVPPGPAPRPAPSGDFFGWIRSLRLARGGDRWVGGVASGLAHRWGVDPVLVRGLFIVATIFLGVGVLAYGILWLLLPEPDGRIHAQEAAHGRWTAGMTGGLIVTILGLGGARAGFWFGESGIGGAFWGLFWIAVVAFGIYSIVRGSRRRAGYRAGWQSPSPMGPGTGTGGAPGPDVAAGEVPAPGDDYYTKPGTAPSYASPTGHGTAAQPRPPQQAPLPERTQWSEQTQSSEQARAVPYYGGQGEPSAPPYYGGSLPTVPVQASPRSPRRRGPSAPFVLVVLGAAALVAGTLGVLVVTGALPLAPGAIWTAVAIVIGLGIVIAGLRGRTAGVLTVFAVVALVSAAVSQSVERFSDVRTHTASYAPATISQATAGYDITGAKGTLDLSALDAAPLAADATVPVKITMSDIAITVPKDVPVEVRSTSTLAAVKADGRTSAGLSQRDTTTYNSGKPGATLLVDLDATLSNVTITEER